MTTATRPITISNANQYVDRPLDAGVVLNTPFSIFRTLGKKAFIVPDYMPKVKHLPYILRYMFLPIQYSSSR